MSGPSPPITGLDTTARSAHESLIQGQLAMGSAINPLVKSESFDTAGVEIA